MMLSLQPPPPPPPPPAGRRPPAARPPGARGHRPAHLQGRNRRRPRALLLGGCVRGRGRGRGSSTPTAAAACQPCSSTARPSVGGTCVCMWLRMGLWPCYLPHSSLRPCGACDPQPTSSAWLKASTNQDDSSWHACVFAGNGRTVHPLHAPHTPARGAAPCTPSCPRALPSSPLPLQWHRFVDIVYLRQSGSLPAQVCTGPGVCLLVWCAAAGRGGGGRGRGRQLPCSCWPAATAPGTERGEAPPTSDPWCPGPLVVLCAFALFMALDDEGAAAATAAAAPPDMPSPAHAPARRPQPSPRHGKPSQPASGSPVPTNPPRCPSPFPLHLEPRSTPAAHHHDHGCRRRCAGGARCAVCGGRPVGCGQARQRVGRHGRQGAGGAGGRPGWGAEWARSSRVLPSL